MSNEVYRIRCTMQLNAASTSTNDIKLYTSQEDLLAALLPLSMRKDRHRDRPSSRLARVLLDFWMAIIDPTDDRGYPYPISINVEKHITDTLTGEGRWLSMVWSYEPPKVTINGTEVSQ